MRSFARPMPLSTLSLEARVLYSAFCVFLLLAIGTSVWLFHDDGFSLRAPQASVQRYYLGDKASPTATSNDAQLVLPDDVVPLDAAPAKSARQMVETFHFHMFTVPLCLLVVGHLFMMVNFTTRKKVALLLLASVSTLLHILAPIAVRFVHPGLSLLFVPSALVMAVTWAVMLATPLWQMWQLNDRQGKPASLS